METTESGIKFEYFEPSGVPVFKPTMEQFSSFKAFMEQVDAYGMVSGIIKIIPPKEWSEILPNALERVEGFKIHNPIEQNFQRGGGLPSGTFRQINLERKKTYTIQEWYDLSKTSDYAPPIMDELTGQLKQVQKAIERTKKRKKSQDKENMTVTANKEVHEKIMNKLNTKALDSGSMDAPKLNFPQFTNTLHATPKLNTSEPKLNLDLSELKKHTSYALCKDIERFYWKNISYAPPLYGADLIGTLFKKEDHNSWDPGRLENVLNNLRKRLPGVNVPYLYFGLWKATFSWHVEDMDLYSINFIHFGAPKQWYVVPPAHASRFEVLAKGIFFEEASRCKQFLRHKSSIISPNVLANHHIPVHRVVQQPGEIIITFPNGYHSGYNLGFNCAESVNFALERWIEIGMMAKFCSCVDDSVRLDIREFIGAPKIQYEERIDPLDSDEELIEKRRLEILEINRVKKVIVKKAAVKKIKHAFPSNGIYCSLCPIIDRLQDLLETDIEGKFAHKICASSIPETYVEEHLLEENTEMVFGMQDIPKSRFNLKCEICKLSVQFGKGNGGACIQCFKGQCKRAYHVTCAEANNIFLELHDEGKGLAECYCPQHDPKTHVSRKEDKLREIQDYAILHYTPGCEVSMRWDGTFYSGIVSRILIEQRSCFVDFEGEEERYIVPWTAIKLKAKEEKSMDYIESQLVYY